MSIVRSPQWLFILFLLGYPSVAGADQGTALDDAFRIAISSHNIEEMMASVEANPLLQSQYVYSGLWYAAALWSHDGRFKDDQETQYRALKVMLFATLLELFESKQSTTWPKKEGITNIGPNALASFSQSSGIGQQGSPLYFLLERSPEFKVNHWNGFYYYEHLDISSIAKRIVFEKSDTPWSNLGSSFSITHSTDLSPNEQSKALPVEASSYTFPLSSMNFYILAAKTYMCMALLNKTSPAQTLGHVIIANAFYSAALVEGAGHNAIVLNQTAVFPLKQAINQLKKNPIAEGHILSPQVLEFRLTSAMFFARKLKLAEQRYEMVLTSDAEKNKLVYAHWGGFITALGLSNEEKTVANLSKLFASIDDISDVDAPYRYMLIAMNDILNYSAELRNVFGHNSKRMDAWRKSPRSERFRYNMNLDLGRILWTIGLSEPLIRLYVREIKRLPSPPSSKLSSIEKDYLINIGASMADLFSQLSWELDLESKELETDSYGWYKPHGMDRNEWHKDFAPTHMDLLFDRGEGEPYGAVNPEEDRATMIEAYAPKAFVSKTDLLLQQLSKVPELRMDTPNTSLSKHKDRIKIWALNEYKKGNIEPLIKVAWLEWFAVPMADLQSSVRPPSQWRYSPLSDRNSEIYEILESLAMDKDFKAHSKSKNVAAVFLFSYRFLADQYR